MNLKQTRAAGYTHLLLMGALASAMPGCVAETDEDEAEADELGEVQQPLLTINEQGWAWVRASGSVGGSDAWSGAVSATKVSTGRYEVTVSGAPFLNRHVVAYGADNTFCQLVGGQGGPIRVDCYTPSGNRIDSDFVVTFDARSGTVPAYAGGAYLSAQAAGGAASVYSWNSTGATNTVAWSAGGGEYVASLPGLGFTNASVHVTANNTSPTRCKVRSWGGGQVRVKCFDLNGAAVQSQFELSYNRMTQFGYRPGGHAWVNGGTPSPSYSDAQAATTCGAAGSFSASPDGSALRIDLSVTAFPPSSWTQFVPMVSGYGSSTDYCKIQNWGVSSGYRVRVRCFDDAGASIAPSTTPFTVTFTDNFLVGPC